MTEERQILGSYALESAHHIRSVPKVEERRILSAIRPGGPSHARLSKVSGSISIW